MTDDKLLPLGDALDRARQRMANEVERRKKHEVTLGYTADDDGIHINCACGVDIPLGFNPGMSELALKVWAHWQEVGLE